VTIIRPKASQATACRCISGVGALCKKLWPGVGETRGRGTGEGGNRGKGKEMREGRQGGDVKSPPTVISKRRRLTMCER